MTGLNTPPSLKVVSAAIEAVKALHKKAQPSPEEDILTEDSDLLLVHATVETTAGKPSNHWPVLLPYSPWAENTKTCLLTRNPGDEFLEEVEALEMEGSVTVMDLTKLRRDFKSYSQKRQLAKSFNVFAADEAIQDFLPELLGRDIINSPLRMPIKVRIRNKNSKPFSNQSERLMEAILEARQSVTVNLSKTSASVPILVGNTNMGPKEVLANLTAVLEFFNKKNRKLIKLSIQTRSSTALPLPLNIDFEGDEEAAPEKAGKQKGQKRPREEAEAPTEQPAKKQKKGGEQEKKGGAAPQKQQKKKGGAETPKEQNGKGKGKAQGKGKGGQTPKPATTPVAKAPAPAGQKGKKQQQAPKGKKPKRN